MTFADLLHLSVVKQIKSFRARLSHTCSISILKRKKRHKLTSTDKYCINTLYMPCKSHLLKSPALISLQVWWF